jgi:hypothetical protein
MRWVLVLLGEKVLSVFRDGSCSVTSRWTLGWVSITSTSVPELTRTALTSPRKLALYERDAVEIVSMLHLR